jgi:1-acyl-sn-glycerol-3-phosphate acyltransferase
MRLKDRTKVAFLLRAALTTLVITVTSIAILPIAAVTGFRARRLYAGIAARLARGVLRLWGIQLQVSSRWRLPSTQVVYISNHSSTIDLFALVALGLPRTRFFLGGHVQKYLPLAILARLMGTFFTVPQDRPEARRRIFSAACDTLRRTGESVYLSPEGGRITTGDIGSFNKGAFHLATVLGAPIVPLYFAIPPAIDPGMGFDAGAGRVDVIVKPPIDTRGWRLEDLALNKERVREMFVAWHNEAKEARHAA